MVYSTPEQRTQDHTSGQLSSANSSAPDHEGEELTMANKRTRFTAITAAVVLLSAITAGTAGAAQAPNSFCLGLTIETAEAKGYRVQTGTDGVDVLIGGNTTKDFILGFGGDDILTGAGADDVICGGSGNDIINGGDGNDRVAGGPGNDEINLGAGNDRARGGWGTDQIIGGTGNDLLQGNGGNDRISGEAGNDVILGNLGGDTLFGGDGNDLIRGLRGMDKIAGGPGDDRLEGGNGDDILSGDDGADRIFGGPGRDALDGDAGADILNAGTGRDRCDIDDGDDLTYCDIDFDGVAVNPPAETPASTPAPEATPEPEDGEVAPPAGAAVPASQAPQGVNSFGWPLLTNAGLEAMLLCESGGNHAIDTGNRFYGGVQWLPNTWNAATVRAGFPQYDGVLPSLVPADVQDAVTKVWWEATRPNTQWPTCHKKALEAMNVLAP